jgi:RNA polymerase sigma-70 factor (ECF subfamily)
MSEFNETRAFEAELVSLIPNLRAFGRHLSGDVQRGEDLAQETLTKAWASRHRFVMGTNMKAWVFMILRNVYFSEQRRNWRSRPLSPELAERTLVAVTGDTDRLELDELRRAMAMLSPDHREALLLIGAAGLSYEEASAITGCAIGTIKSRVSRARDQIALFYAEGDILPDIGRPHDAMASIFAQVEGCVSAA